MQRESLKGIAYLALDDQFRVGIIEGPLREIICILVDSNVEPELRTLAESVIVNIGFHQGRKDLEIVGHDYSLLAVWFYLKRSLRPQALAYPLLQQWIDTIFRGEDYAEKHARRRFILSELGRDDSQFEGDEGSLLISFPDGTSIDLRDTLDLSGLSALLDIITYVVPSHSRTMYRRPSRGMTMSIGPETSMREALLIQYAHLYETWKMIRHGLPETARIVPGSSKASEEEWDSDAKVNTILSRRRSNNPLEIFFRYLSACTGRSSTQNVLDEDDIDVNYVHRSDSSYEKELDISNIFTPPSQVLELLNAFFPSPSYQCFLLDFLSIGDIVHTVDNEASYHHVPQPLQFRGLLLPPRHYLSFKREGRIIERIIEDFIALGTVYSHGDIDKTARINMKVESSLIGASPDVLWTLCFRDSSFAGEFHHDLLHILRRCPQISSLNFVNKRPERDNALGYLAGSVPASVRFLTFESVLSSDSIQLLCVKIRTQNAAYSQHLSSAMDGLRGLSLRSHHLVADDIKHICELLDVSRVAQLNGSDEHFSYSLPRLHINQKLHPTGLKYLDLSDSHLTDQACADILKAAAGGGHLESLELSRNYIGKGVLFTEALSFFARKGHLLKYLGVSMNALHNTSFRGILNGCLNSRIRHLDVSGNFLTDTKNNRECMRNFLRASTAMCVLNLSGNRFTADMAKTVYLGLLENDTMLQ